MRTLAILLVGLLATGIAAQTPIFSDDFNTSMPAQISPGVAALEGVQGYAGLGPAGRMFGGTFLRSPTGNVVTLTLTGLPTHNALNLEFLFAAIDSLDGTGIFPAGDFFHVRLDGNTVFRESFANALPSQIQSYVPAPGAELARRVNLGFSGPRSYFTDSAYDFGVEPMFANLPHSSSSAVFTFEIEGPGIQGLADESWAMDELSITLVTQPTGSVAAYGTSCGPALTATGVPRVGQSIPLTLDNLPANATQAFCALGLSNTTWGGSTLPLPLDTYGMNGCWLLQDMAIAFDIPMLLSAGTATITFGIPNDPSLLNLQIFAQGWVLAPGVNAGSTETSGGLRMVIGS